MNIKQNFSSLFNQLIRNSGVRACTYSIISNDEDLKAGFHGNITDLLFMEMTNIFEIVHESEDDPAKREQIIIGFAEACIKDAHEHRLKAQGKHCDDVSNPMDEAIANTISPQRMSIPQAVLDEIHNGNEYTSTAFGEMNNAIDDCE